MSGHSLFCSFGLLILLVSLSNSMEIFTLVYLVSFHRVDLIVLHVII